MLKDFRKWICSACLKNVPVVKLKLLFHRYVVSKCVRIVDKVSTLVLLKGFLTSAFPSSAAVSICNPSLKSTSAVVNFYPLSLKLVHAKACVRILEPRVPSTGPPLLARPPRPPRPPRPGPCLDFGFQYALIRNNQSKNVG